MQGMIVIPLLIKTFSHGLLFVVSLVRSYRRRRWLASFPVHAPTMAAHHVDLLLAALLYGCAFSGALLAATALALIAFLAASLLVMLALAASDARRLAGPAARVADAAAASLRVARAVAVYAVLRAAVRVALALRPKLVWRCEAGRGLFYRVAPALSLPRAEHFTVVA